MSKRASSSHSGPSQRQLRVGEQLKHIVAETLQRCAFQAEILQRAMVTVTEVRCSPDLRQASAYVGVMGAEDVAAVIAALNDESREIQREISKQSTSKYTPKINFKADDTLDNASRIYELLNEIERGD